ncbi:MAG: 2-dehydropantoate 2-reductase [Methylobacter sp.]|uniref:ketopantoate reductase family protein n=1 Tax=Methylobacter sp. TaxID=2051955 RepID=UPI002730B03B|nr:2-dehydropantoate 2-reductase [Methylobacter sp.]MDP1665119.1 2-dehydropantoate 2-reductase [Methylobacter sp.]MDP1970857.1 2-dehydropantoate 2-reductase [Methylobacter sp.]
MIKVLVIGAGAIGAFYGSLLAKAGAEVSVVCRSDYDHVKQHGFIIDSHPLDRRHFTPTQVLKNAADFEETADYVLLCTKVIPTLDRIGLIRPAVTQNTAIVFIQNGVEIEQEMLDAFPNNEVISGLAFIGCNRVSPGEILHLAYGRLALGNLPNGVSAKTAQLCELFNQSGIESKATEDIVTGRWQKCVWNAPFNPLSVLSGGLPTLDILQNQELFVRSIMQEVCDIAAAAGHPLPDDIISINIEHTYAMPPYKTSMLLDYENGLPMETEAILGNALRAAQRLGIAAPHLESVYALMKLRELKLSYLE